MQIWAVFGNDPNDATGIPSILEAEHSAGKPEMMVSAAFPHLTPAQVRHQFIRMAAFDVFSSSRRRKRESEVYW
jgi:hypothetical protein